jgi:hypothetical protein
MFITGTAFFNYKGTGTGIVRKLKDWVLRVIPILLYRLM